MISLEDYEAMQETAYLLLAVKNARRLLESVTMKRNFLNEAICLDDFGHLVKQTQPLNEVNLYDQVTTQLGLHEP
ncbi:hypothetical protein SAMN04488142_3744 [Halomonas sp. hl-4]|nr:hypothetical protein SAMN04488142_3744 [Halomonas sp. hl-4]